MLFGKKETVGCRGETIKTTRGVGGVYPINKDMSILYGNGIDHPWSIT